VTDRSGDLIRVEEVEERKKSRGAERYMKEDQKKVVKKSLKLSNPEHLKGKDILLIDDIATTWDTMDCCASVVAEDARPGSIRSLVLGRTNPPKKSK
jgi:hypoxanthine phosphoribosyltransferase